MYETKMEKHHVKRVKNYNVRGECMIIIIPIEDPLLSIQEL